MISLSPYSSSPHPAVNRAKMAGMLEQLISLIGAAMILIAYGANQMGRMDRNSPVYLTLNFVGAIILGIIAARVKQIGLTILEGTWALISLIALVKYFAKRSN